MPISQENTNAAIQLTRRPEKSHIGGDLISKDFRNWRFFNKTLGWPIKQIEILLVRSDKLSPRTMDIKTKSLLLISTTLHTWLVRLQDKSTCSSKLTDVPQVTPDKSKGKMHQSVHICYQPRRFAAQKLLVLKNVWLKMQCMRIEK